MRVVTLACLLLVSDASAADSGISARLEPTTIVVGTSEGTLQVVLAEITSPGLREATLRLTAPGWARPVKTRLGEIAKGKQTVRVLVPSAASEMKLSGVLECQGNRIELPSAVLRPARQWTMYLVQHTHTDIGYTRPQTEILPEHLRYIDYALDYLRPDRQLPGRRPVPLDLRDLLGRARIPQAPARRADRAAEEARRAKGASKSPACC